MRLSLKGMTIAGGLLWGGAILFLGLINLVRPTYGVDFSEQSVQCIRGFTCHSRSSMSCEVSAISAELHRVLGLTEQQCVDVIATVTSLAGALWQMATPGPEVAALYRSDPRLAHAVVEVGPRLTRVLTALLAGLHQSG